MADVENQPRHSFSLNQDSASEVTLTQATGSHYCSMGIGIRGDICLSSMRYVAHEVGYILQM